MAPCRPLLSSDRAFSMSLKLGRWDGLSEMQRRMTSASAGGASLGTLNGSRPARGVAVKIECS